MTIDQARIWVSQMYPSESWRARVNRMPDSQVFAIYKRVKDDPRYPVTKNLPEKAKMYEQIAMDIDI